MTPENAFHEYVRAVERCAYRVQGVADALSRVGMDRLHGELDAEATALLELAGLIGDAYSKLSHESYAASNDMANTIFAGILEGVIRPKSAA